MEDIEYLEEYEDLILPTIATNNDNHQLGVDAGALPSSGVVDESSMDNILDLLDEHSNILHSKVDTNISQRGCDERASLDSLDALYKDLVGEELLQPSSTVVSTQQATSCSNKISVSQSEQSKDRIPISPNLLTSSTTISNSEQRPVQKGNASIHTSSSSMSMSSSSSLRGRNTPNQLNRSASNQSGSTLTQPKTLPTSRPSASQKIDRFKSVATVRPTLHQSSLAYPGRVFGGSSKTSKQPTQKTITSSSVHSSGSSNYSKKPASQFNISNSNKSTTSLAASKVRPNQAKSLAEDPLSLDDVLDIDTYDSDDDSDMDSLNDFPDLDDSDDFTDSSDISDAVSDSDDYDSDLSKSSNDDIDSTLLRGITGETTKTSEKPNKTLAKQDNLESRLSKNIENNAGPSDSVNSDKLKIKETPAKRPDQIGKHLKNVESSEKLSTTTTVAATTTAADTTTTLVTTTAATTTKAATSTTAETTTAATTKTATTTKTAATTTVAAATVATTTVATTAAATTTTKAAATTTKAAITTKAATTTTKAATTTTKAATTTTKAATTTAKAATTKAATTKPAKTTVATATTVATTTAATTTTASASVQSEQKSKDVSKMEKPLIKEPQLKSADPLATSSDNLPIELHHYKEIEKELELIDSLPDKITNEITVPDFGGIVKNITSKLPQSSEEVKKQKVTSGNLLDATDNTSKNPQVSFESETFANDPVSKNVLNEKTNEICNMTEENENFREVESTTVQDELPAEKNNSEKILTPPNDSENDTIKISLEINSDEIREEGINNDKEVNRKRASSLPESEGNQKNNENLSLKELEVQENKSKSEKSMESVQNINESEVREKSHQIPTADKQKVIEAVVKEKLPTEIDRPKRKSNSRSSRGGRDSLEKLEIDYKRRKTSADDKLNKKIPLDLDTKKFIPKTDNKEEIKQKLKKSETSQSEESKLSSQLSLTKNSMEEKSSNKSEESNDLKDIDKKLEDETSQSDTRIEMGTSKLFAVTEEKQFKLKPNIKSSLRKSSSEVDGKNESVNDSLNETKTKQVRFKLSSPDDIEYILASRKKSNSKSSSKQKSHKDLLNLSNGSQKIKKPIIRPSLLCAKSLTSPDNSSIFADSSKTTKLNNSNYVADEIGHNNTQKTTKELGKDLGSKEEISNKLDLLIPSSFNTKSRPMSKEDIAKDYKLNCVVRVSLTKLSVSLLNEVTATAAVAEASKVAADAVSSKTLTVKRMWTEKSETEFKPGAISTPKTTTKTKTKIKPSEMSRLAIPAETKLTVDASLSSVEAEKPKEEPKTLTPVAKLETQKPPSADKKKLDKSSLEKIMDIIGTHKKSSNVTIKQSSSTNRLCDLSDNTKSKDNLIASHDPLPSSSVFHHEPLEAKHSYVTPQPTDSATVTKSKLIQQNEDPSDLSKTPARKSKRKSAGQNYKALNKRVKTKNKETSLKLRKLRIILDPFFVDNYMKAIRLQADQAQIMNRRSKKTHVTMKSEELGSSNKKTPTRSKSKSASFSSTSSETPKTSTIQNFTTERIFNTRNRSRAVNKSADLPASSQPKNNKGSTDSAQINGSGLTKMIVDEASLLTPIKTGKVYPGRKGATKSVSKDMPQIITKASNASTMIMNSTATTMMGTEGIAKTTTISNTALTPLTTASTYTTTMQATKPTIIPTTIGKSALTIEHSILPDMIQPKTETDKDDSSLDNTDLNPPIVQPIIQTNNACRTYSFKTPAKRQRNSGALLLDYCCSNIDGININRDTNFWSPNGNVNTVVRELPSYIVMEAKIITQAELRANKNLIPAPVLQKMQKFHHLVSTDAANSGSGGGGSGGATGGSSSAASDVSSESLLQQQLQKQQQQQQLQQQEQQQQQHQQQQQKQQTNDATTVNAAVRSTSPPPLVPTSAALALISASPSASSSMMSSTIVTHAQASTMQVSNSVAIGRNTEVQKEMLTICKHIDLLLRKNASNVLSMTIKERQQRLLNVAASSSLTIQDAASAYAILQQYFDSKLPRSQTKQVPIMDKKRNIIGYQMKDVRYSPYPTANSSCKLQSPTTPPPPLATLSNLTSASTSALSSPSATSGLNSSGKQQHFTSTGKPAPVGQNDSPRIFFTKPPYLSKNIVVKPVNSGIQQKLPVNHRMNQKKISRSAPAPTLPTSSHVTTVAAVQNSIPKASITSNTPKTPRGLLIVTKEQKATLVNQQNKDEMIIPDNDPPIAQRIKTEESADEECITGDA